MHFTRLVWNSSLNEIIQTVSLWNLYANFQFSNFQDIDQVVCYGYDSISSPHENQNRQQYTVINLTKLYEMIYPKPTAWETKWVSLYTKRMPTNCVNPYLLWDEILRWEMGHINLYWFWVYWFLSMLFQIWCVLLPRGLRPNCMRIIFLVSMILLIASVMHGRKCTPWTISEPLSSYQLFLTHRLKKKTLSLSVLLWNTMFFVKFL